MDNKREVDIWRTICIGEYRTGKPGKNHFKEGSEIR